MLIRLMNNSDNGFTQEKKDDTKNANNVMDSKGVFHLRKLWDLVDRRILEQR